MKFPLTAERKLINVQKHFHNRVNVVPGNVPFQTSHQIYNFLPADFVLAGDKEKKIIMRLGINICEPHLCPCGKQVESTGSTVYHVATVLRGSVGTTWSRTSFL